MTEALRSGAITGNIYVVIDNFGALWSWKQPDKLEPQKVEGDYPFFVSVIGDYYFVFVLDEFGDVWRAPVADELKLQKTEIMNMRSIYPSNTNGFCFALDDSGTLWKMTVGDKKILNEKLPPLQMFSSSNCKAGVDFDGNVWTWRNDKKIPKKIDLPFKMAKSAFAEFDIVKILCEDGKLWKFFDHDTPVAPLFHQLPPLITVSVSGAHSIALCEDGTAYGWGSNHSGELGIDFQTANAYSPCQIPNIPPINTAICGPYYSMLIGKDGELFILRLGIQRTDKIPQAFIRKRSAKSARK